MANYLLLRNNKESGPYSLDGLLELGLKPYDLIWIQGKSAAWRYPSEVEEFKNIAPAVEEQPFDRFFKKPEEKKETPLTEERQPQRKETSIKPEYEKYIPKSSVYVTMPGQKAAQAKETVKEPVRETVKQTINETIATTPVQPTITISENPVASQVKYSQPLDEIKEMYVKTLHNRKQKIARKSFWMQSLKKAAALMSLVAVGLIAGFVIKSNGSKQKDIVQQQTVLPAQPVTSELAATVPGVNIPDTNTAPIEDIQSLHQPTGGFVNKNPVQLNNTIETNQSPDKQISKNNFKKETVTPENKAVNSFVPESVETDPVTGERNRKVRSATTESLNDNKSDPITEKNNEKKPPYAHGLSRLVSAKSNEYKRVAFGGIRDLQVTVTNNSKYVLDNVIVEIQYIKPNELPLKTEIIEFSSIGPNATSTIRLPDTNRGIKVVYRILHIKSRQMDEVVSGN